MTEQETKIWHVRQAVKWACERESVRIKKVAGLPKPWTQDPYLQSYRFCNVSRQDDKETVELNEKFFKPGIQAHGERDLWFNVALARWINWSPTVIGIGWTDLSNGYDADDLYARMVKASGAYGSDGQNNKFFTGAYMVRGCTSAKEVGGDEELYQKCKDKRYFLSHVVLKGIYEIGPPEPGETLESYHGRLTKAKSNGLFMSGQQIADLKYYTMKDAPDWKTWAPWGPGPARFMNRMNGRPLEKQIPMAQFLEEQAEFDSMLWQELDAYEFDPVVKQLVKEKLQDAHDRKSNLECETDKYIRLQEGGRVRSLYDGKPPTTTKLI